MATVIAPVAGWTGTVGVVDFSDGVGHTDDPRALRYFQRAGYTIEHDDENPVRRPAKAPATPEPTAPATGPQPSAQPDTAVHLASVPIENATPAAELKAPSPSANKAEWFAYLEQVAPGHGLTIENTRREIISAATGEG